MAAVDDDIDDDDDDIDDDADADNDADDADDASDPSVSLVFHWFPFFPLVLPCCQTGSAARKSILLCQKESQLCHRRVFFLSQKNLLVPEEPSSCVRVYSLMLESTPNHAETTTHAINHMKLSGLV